jgi:hypothetical protein
MLAWSLGENVTVVTDATDSCPNNRANIVSVQIPTHWQIAMEAFTECCHVLSTHPWLYRATPALYLRAFLSDRHSTILRMSATSFPGD